MTKDFTKNNQIKDEQYVVLRDLDRIMGRWKECIDKLRIKGVSLRMQCQMMVIQGISRNEVDVTLSCMKKGKTTGMYGIPVDVWRCLREEGNMVQSVYEQDNITNEVESLCECTNF